MNVLFEAALEIQQFLRDQEWRFCIIGGLAVARWGRPQATQDVDLSLLTGFGNESRYVDPILARFPGRIAEAGRFALENRVLLLSASNGSPLDICLAGIPFEERMIGRASPFAFAPDVSLVTCSAEDLVIMKVFAGRQRDWTAVREILVSQAEELDWDYIRENLPPLCELKETPDSLARLEELRTQLAE